MNAATISAFCERQLPATLDFLRRMVAINSFTENVAGVNTLGELVAAEFAPLGFEASFPQPPQSRFGRHLFLRRTAANAPTIALISHLDTVFTAEEEKRNNFVWRIEGRRIHGPGTNDIKGGTALIHLVLAALRSEAPEVFERTNWVVALNSCEETVSEDFGRICRAELPADTRGCLVFEADRGADGDFGVVAARKGRATISVEVEGRGSHAGGEHPRGANAIVQLAIVIERLAALTDYAGGVTINVGTIAGGTVINRVPHSARAVLEMRAFTAESYEHTKQAILGLAGEGSVRSADGHACVVSVRVEEETVPWPSNAHTERLLALWQETGRALGVRVTRIERGGLSDGNLLWDKFPTLDGLGPHGDHAHCSEQSPDGRKQQEWVDAESFVPKAVLNALAIARLAAKGC
ncbi:MAG: M20/M25/M40 family metallo-hydrolase [Chthoniobacteraceae bacterium]